MRHGICAILLLAASSQLVFAQTLDKAKFRQAIELPVISTHFGVQFRSHERDGRGQKFDAGQKLAELQRKLSGGPEDAEIYLEQRAVYLECVKDEKKAQEMIVKADGLLRPLVQTNDAKQAILLTTYGNVLETTVENPWNDCEKLARRAVTLAPNDWRAWTYLAHVRHQQIPSILCGGDDKQLPKEGRTQEIIGMLYLRRVRAADVNEAEKALNEALQYHDKAKELAPNEPKRQVQRYGFRLTEIVLRNAIAGSRAEKKPPYPQQQLERVVLDELELAARLQPDHLLWQSQLAHQLVMLGWQQNKDKSKTSVTKFQPARPKDAQAIQIALARIEKLADAAQGEAAAFCHSLLAALYSSMQENAAVEKYARKVLAIDPKNQMAAEQLQQALFILGKHADQLQAAQALTQAEPSARNCYLLAKALTFNQRYDLAEQACLAGLKKDPADVYCILGLAALQMRKGDDPQTLQATRELLDKARRACRPEAGTLVFTEIEYLTAAYHALSGDVALAQLKLQHMQAEHRESQRYEKLLASFGR